MPGLPALLLRGVLDLQVLSDAYLGKAVHLFATADIPDLSDYWVGIANNGAGSDGFELPLAGSALG
eukprot:4118553-Prymnesium_polylepis.1